MSIDGIDSFTGNIGDVLSPAEWDKELLSRFKDMPSRDIVNGIAIKDGKDLIDLLDKVKELIDGYSATINSDDFWKELKTIHTILGTLESNYVPKAEVDTVDPYWSSVQ